MLSAVLLWLMLAALLVLPVILRVWAEDEPRNQDPPEDGGGDRDGDGAGMLAA